MDGVDTPEKGWRANAKRKEPQAKAATAFTKQQIDNAKRNAKRIVVRDPKWGKYGGRVIADLVLDGRSLSDELIEGGYGVRYRGGQTKSERKENGAEMVFRFRQIASGSGTPRVFVAHSPTIHPSVSSVTRLGTYSAAHQPS